MPGSCCFGLRKLANCHRAKRCSARAPVLLSEYVMRRLLPVARHREIVVDAAKRLEDPSKASDSDWIQAIYQELQGVGHWAADKSIEKLIEQHIVDAEDGALIDKEFKLYRAQAGAGFNLFERHEMPRIYNKDTADKWVASLIWNRIRDLCSTVEGFHGHAIQVQRSITQLVNAYRNGNIDKEAYDKYKKGIVAALRKRKTASEHAIPQFAYEFEDYSTERI
jgi:hypothetical protein